MDEQQKRQVSPITLFYSYAHEDELLCNELEKHLSLLRRHGLIAEWHDHQIVAGTEWAHEIDEHLETALMLPLLTCTVCLVMASRSLNGTTRMQPFARLRKAFAGFLNNELPRLVLHLAFLRLIGRTACACSNVYGFSGLKECWSSLCIKLLGSKSACGSNLMLSLILGGLPFKKRIKH